MSKNQSSQRTIGDFKETAFNYIAGEKEGTFFTSEAKWVRRIRKLAESHPEIQIVTENADGSIIAQIPVKAFKIQMPRTRVLTDEQKQAAAERMKKARQKKAS